MSKYQTPIGGFDTWEDAAKAVERCDMDPCDTVQYVGVETINGDPNTAIKLSFQIRVF